jgi:hypothetical protein
LKKICCFEISRDGGTGEDSKIEQVTLLFGKRVIFRRLCLGDRDLSRIGGLHGEISEFLLVCDE